MGKTILVANQLGKEHVNEELRIFLLADAVSCAISGQTGWWTAIRY